MDFDQMMETWRGQDSKPLYGVNRDQLQRVLQQERTDMRRRLRRENWAMYSVSALALGFSGAFLLAYGHQGGSAWNLVVAVVATAAVLSGAGALWLSRRRQARRERAFGNSLREEIGRNLSLLDYQLSRKGQTEQGLLAVAPVTLAAWLVYWLYLQINHNAFGWYDAGFLIACLVVAVWDVRHKSRKAQRELLPRRRRLSELLEMLNASE